MKEMMDKVRGNLILLLQPCTIMCVHSGPLGLMATHTRPKRAEFCSLNNKKNMNTLNQHLKQLSKCRKQTIKICTYCLSQKSCPKKWALPFSSTNVTLGCPPLMSTCNPSSRMTKAILGCPPFGTTSLGQVVA